MKKVVELWWDDRGEHRADHPGYVAKCTELDEEGFPIIDRIGMDASLMALKEADAIKEAARYWGVSPKDIILC